MLLSSPTKDAVFTISRAGGESLRTDDWRYTQWRFGQSGLELYDLSKDPGEFTNLANNPEYASVVKKMEARLLAKRDEAGYAGYVASKSNKNGRKNKKQKKNKE